MNYGGFWIRFLAYIVDSLIVTIGFLGIVMLLSAMGLELISNELILLVMGVLYYAFMQSSARQATFGKALVGLKVGGPEGERIGLGRALGREVAKILSVMTFLIGFIIAGFTRRKQALHDFIASTVVVRAEKGQVVAALAVALVALMAPFVVVFMFGAGLVAGMLGGFAGAMPTFPEIAMQAPKPAAPPVPKPAAPVAKPVTVAATAPAPQAPEPPKPAPAAKPVATPAVATPVAAPVVVAQAPEPPKPAAAPKEPAKPVAAEPPKEEPKAAKDEGAPRMAQEPPKPVLVPARPMAPPSPTFNDLATAVIYGDAYAVEQLLAYGKWADKPDSRGVTPLMLAATMGDRASAEALLKAGANPNRPGPGGGTATSIARERKDTAMAGLLQRYGGR